MISLILLLILLAPLILYSVIFLISMKNKQYSVAVFVVLLLGSCGSMYIADEPSHKIESKSTSSIHPNNSFDINDYVTSNDIKLKKHANVKNLDSNIISIIPIVTGAYRDVLGDEYTPTITSGNDSRHSRNSLHYEDKAIDLRTIRSKEINRRKALKIYKKIKYRLPDGYNIILESDHIHLSYNHD
jgi:hypothetical protein